METGYEGTNVYRNFITWSDDEGATWSKPLDITRTTKRPTRATTIASGPGIGIQLTRGPHQGRLIIPFNEGPYCQWNNFAVFSDDRGKDLEMGSRRSRVRSSPTRSLASAARSTKCRWLNSAMARCD